MAARRAPTWQRASRSSPRPQAPVRKRQKERSRCFDSLFLGCWPTSLFLGDRSETCARGERMCTIVPYTICPLSLEVLFVQVCRPSLFLGTCPGQAPAPVTAPNLPRFSWYSAGNGGMDYRDQNWTHLSIPCLHQVNVCRFGGVSQACVSRAFSEALQSSPLSGRPLLKKACVQTLDCAAVPQILRRNSSAGWPELTGCPQVGCMPPGQGVDGARGQKSIVTQNNTTDNEHYQQH